MGGETIRRLAAFIVLAMIASIFPIIADDAPEVPEVPFWNKDCTCCCNKTVNDTPECCLPCWCKPKKMNYDFVNIGDQNAFTAGVDWYAPFDDIPVATNTFAIDKSQLACPCNCSLYNIEMIFAGDQFATALGQGVSTNTVMISTSQA